VSTPALALLAETLRHSISHRCAATLVRSNWLNCPSPAILTVRQSTHRKTSLLQAVALLQARSPNFPVGAPSLRSRCFFDLTIPNTIDLIILNSQNWSSIYRRTSMTLRGGLEDTHPAVWSAAPGRGPHTGRTQSRQQWRFFCMTFRSNPHSLATAAFALMGKRRRWPSRKSPHAKYYADFDPAPAGRLRTRNCEFEVLPIPTSNVVLQNFDHEGYKNLDPQLLERDSPIWPTWYAGNRMRPSSNSGPFLQDVFRCLGRQQSRRSLASARASMTIVRQGSGRALHYYQVGHLLQQRTSNKQVGR